MRSVSAFMARINGGLVVSCQPVPGGPFDSPALVSAFALAAQASGAVGLRIEGAANIRAVVAACHLPVIGLIKRDLPDSPVRITPLLEDVAAIIAAGATVVAVDATQRRRPVALPLLFDAVHRAGCPVMADVSTPAEGIAAHRLGADVVGSTLSGYTGADAPGDAPDLALVGTLVAAGVPTIAEGNYRTPAQAAAAIAAGALAVTVGSAITRPEHVTQWFAAAIAAAHRPNTR